MPGSVVENKSLQKRVQSGGGTGNRESFTGKEAGIPGLRERGLWEREAQQAEAAQVSQTRRGYSDTFPGCRLGLSALGQFGRGPLRPRSSGALHQPPVDSQGPYQPGGQQELHPLDNHDHDCVGTRPADLGTQPPSECRATAPQMHPPQSGTLIQARSSEAAGVVGSCSVFPRAEAAGGRKAAGLGRRGAAVKVPVGYTWASVRRAGPTVPGPGAKLSVSYRPFTQLRPRPHRHACTYAHAHGNKEPAPCNSSRRMAPTASSAHADGGQSLLAGRDGLGETAGGNTGM